MLRPPPACMCRAPPPSGFAPSEESIIDLGRLTFPPELLEYVRSGPTFDPESYLATTANTLVQNLSTSRIGEATGIGYLWQILSRTHQGGGNVMYFKALRSAEVE